MDLTAVREALAANLNRINGLDVSPLMLANPTPPAAHVYPATVDYDVSFGRGGDMQTLTIQVLAGLVLESAAQQTLDQYLAGSGPFSVKEAAESDPQLGGACDDLEVTGSSGYRELQVEGQPNRLVCEWTVVVYGPGN